MSSSSFANSASYWFGKCSSNFLKVESVMWFNWLQVQMNSFQLPKWSKFVKRVKGGQVYKKWKVNQWLVSWNTSYKGIPLWFIWNLRFQEYSSSIKVSSQFWCKRPLFKFKTHSCGLIWGIWDNWFKSENSKLKNYSTQNST